MRCAAAVASPGRPVATCREVARLPLPRNATAGAKARVKLLKAIRVSTASPVHQPATIAVLRQRVAALSPLACRCCSPAAAPSRVRSGVCCSRYECRTFSRPCVLAAVRRNAARARARLPRRLAALPPRALSRLAPQRRVPPAQVNSGRATNIIMNHNARPRVNGSSTTTRAVAPVRVTPPCHVGLAPAPAARAARRPPCRVTSSPRRRRAGAGAAHRDADHQRGRARR